MKGFDVYQKLDKLLKDKINRKKYRFTYIGNLPKNFYFSNTKYIKPLSGQKLAKELSKHHVYLTASINEPAGMHHIEEHFQACHWFFEKVEHYLNIVLNMELDLKIQIFCQH